MYTGSKCTGEVFQVGDVAQSGREKDLHGEMLYFVAMKMRLAKNKKHC